MAGVAQHKAVIATILKEALAPVRIREVRIEDAKGFYGDPVCRIEVMLEDGQQSVAPEKAVQAMDRIRQALIERGHEDCLPLLTLLTPEEAAHAAA